MDLQPAVVSSKARWHWVPFSLFFLWEGFFFLLSLCDYCSKEWLCGFLAPSVDLQLSEAHALTLPGLRGTGLRQQCLQPGV